MRMTKEKDFPLRRREILRSIRKDDFLLRRLEREFLKKTKENDFSLRRKEFSRRIKKVDFFSRRI